ncbi:MAG TPA: FAD:protein FMN transferase [Lacipirellulaceae bacterium]|jgi:thiamine biosynthesis lipoprotein|nr:FAD:protein FMN transferase [Lacipirellulaceae bacterium]
MSTPRPTRRSFLQGEAASREWSAESRQPDENLSEIPATEARASSPPLAVDRSMLLVSVRRRAMACEFEVQLAADRNDGSMEHVFAALDLVEAIESQLTVYRDVSEVNSINRQASAEPVAVEPRLYGLFELAATLHRDTDGAFDITSGPLSQAWGFFRREGRVPSDDEIAAAHKLVSMRHVTLDAKRHTVAFNKPGVTVNFNSMGKGYALDRMAELLAEQNVDDYLIHGGKSSVLARGDQPGHDDGGWTIGLRHPLRPAQRVAEFQLRDQSLSTSGSGTQFFIRRGKRYGHILDPRTGRPSEGLYSATVIAPTACEADALSTAFYVMGPEKVGEYCAARPEIATLLVAPGEREGDVQLFAFGLGDEQWTQLADR